MDMKHLGHPSYACIDEETVQARAAMLPADGIPPEALKVIQQDASDETHDKLQPQKAATPCDGRLGPIQAGQVFAAQPPRAIVAEGNAGHNASQVAQAALEEMATRLAPPSKAPGNPAAGLDTLEIRTGNQMLDQFQPGYFSIAFPFCFPHATACPAVFNVVKQPEGASYFRRDQASPPGWQLQRTQCDLQQALGPCHEPASGKPTPT